MSYEGVAHNLNEMIKHIQDTLQTKGTVIPIEDKNKLESMLSNAQNSYIEFVKFASTSNERTINAINDNADCNKASKYITEMLDEYTKIINKLEKDSYSQMKETQFNIYFSQANIYNIKIMKILVYASVSLMVVIFLYKQKLLSNTLYLILSSIIISVSLYYVVTMIISESSRTSYNFDQIKWSFNPKTAP